MEDLPNEVLLEVFRFVSVHDALSMLLVCKKWQKIMQNPLIVSFHSTVQSLVERFISLLREQVRP